CHGGPELTNASVRNVTNERLERMHMGNDGIAVYDNGFYNIGTRPTEDDLGVGGSDPFGNPLSETRYCQQFVDQGQACPIKNQNASGQFLMTGIADMIVARPGENIPADRLRPSCPPPATTSVFNPITGTFICDRTNVRGLQGAAAAQRRADRAVLPQRRQIDTAPGGRLLQSRRRLRR